jgi:hypothetical protein
MERIVLITNLLDVAIDTGFGKVLTHTNALVLSDRGPDDKTGAQYRAHGFRNEAGNPTFDLTLPSFDWAIEPLSYRRAFVLCFAGQAGPRITLTTDFANDAPLDIEHLELTGEVQYNWDDTLVRKVLRYYHAPYIVLGKQLDADLARKALGVEGVERGVSR